MISSFKGSPGNHIEETSSPLAIALPLLRHDSGDTGQGRYEENPGVFLSEVKGDFSVKVTQCSFPLKQWGWRIHSLVFPQKFTDHSKVSFW